MGVKLRKICTNVLYLLPALLILSAILIFRDRLSHIVNPLIISVILFFLFNPAVERLSGRNPERRSFAILIVFLIAVIFLTGVVVFIIPMIKENLLEISDNISVIKKNLISLWRKLYNLLDDGGGKIAENIFGSILNVENPEENGGFVILDSVEKKLTGTIASYTAPKNIVDVGGFLIDILTSLVITYYLLKDREKAGNTVLSVFPYGWREFLTETYQDIEKIIQSFVSGQLIIAFIIGALETLGLWIIGAPYPILLGIIGGISNMIPYFGPFIGAVPAIIAMLFISPFKALFVILLFVGVQQLDNSFISPKIIEGKLGIHPVVTILAVFIGGEFFGVAGMLLAVPVYAILRGICFRIIKFSDNG